MSEDLVFVRAEDVDAVFEEIKSFEITLSSDPSTLGAPYLLEMTAKVRNNTNRITLHLNRMTQLRLHILRSLNALKTLYKQSSNRLLSEDETVRAQKSIKDREAVIAMMLKDEAQTIASLEAQLHEAETLIETLRMTHREMRDVAGELRSQSKIIEVELRTKAYFGDEGPVPSEQAQAFTKEVDDFLSQALPS